MSPRGTHRIRIGDLAPTVWVTDGTQGFEIPEDMYRERGYAPDLESLPYGNSSPLPPHEG